MFGAYRMVLALMVALSHIGGAWGLGAYAVFGFFVLSGYLMTHIMHRTYGFTASGIGRYVVNRFLRIYPMYWLACLVSAGAVIAADPEITDSLAKGMGLPITLGGWVQNLLLVLFSGSKPVLIYPAWALTLELFFYVAIAFSVSRTRLGTGIWFVLGLGYALVVNVLGLDWKYKYFSVFAASLPFSVGALIFHYRDALSGRLAFLNSHPVRFGIASLLFVNWILSKIWPSIYQPLFYSNLLIHALIIVSLLDMPETGWLTRKWDSWLGNFSYPIYLIHMPVGVLAVAMGSPFTQPSPGLFVLSFPLLALISWGMIICLENPIDRLRMRFK